MKSPFLIKRGYSLAEIIIYGAILAVLVVVLSTMLSGLVRSKDKINSAQRVTNSAVFALDRLVREIRQAKSINTSSSVFGSTPGVLVLNSTDDTGALKTVEFSLSSGALRIKENGIDIGPLTLTNATVTSLIFWRSVASTSREAVKIEINITSGTSTAYKSEKFYSTVGLRQGL